MRDDPLNYVEELNTLAHEEDPYRLTTAASNQNGALNEVLFTLLEDSGYLPRIAFNLDRGFKRCHACGKQALTMCMGFGCNAAGITGCRIIDSPRERLIAIITNNFVPCNGRFPTLIAIITMFFVGGAMGAFSSVVSTLILTAVIVLGVLMTFAVSALLSRTILKGCLLYTSHQRISTRDVHHDVLAAFVGIAPLRVRDRFARPVAGMLVALTTDRCCVSAVRAMPV